jgi:exodeoxyribonuclease VII large subunit
VNRRDSSRRRTPGGARGRRTNLDLFGESIGAAQGFAEMAGTRVSEPAGRPLPPAVAAIPGCSPAAAIAISSLTRIAREVLEGAFTPLWVRGEVSDFKAHRNGHWYFCLRDRTAQVRCVIWSRDQSRIPVPPDDGMQIVAFGQLSVYPTRGDMQFVVSALDALGDGLWRRALEKARAKLDADGLLDPARRRRLPRLPRCVAIVTSPDGAALHDIVSVIRRRCSSVQMVVVAARVQGDGAPQELAAAIERVSAWGGADVLIVGRGGGGREDLWAFNNERVARALAACKVPTISAVGHEVDVTLCDLVADVRAATPSAAAECAVPLLSDELAALTTMSHRLHESCARRLDAAGDRLRDVARAFGAASTRAIERQQRRIEALAGRLNALSPLATLSRGYAVARGADGATLSSVAAFPAGLPFVLTVRDGRVWATAERADGTEPDPSGSGVPSNHAGG